VAQATSSDGTTIVWDQRGDGPPVVLVHGITENATSWDPVTEQLAVNHRVITLDLRGHGRSGRAVSGDYGLAAMAGDVAAVIAAAGADRPHLVGHSLGGAVVSAAGAGMAVASVVNVDQPLQLGEFKNQVSSFEAQLRDPSTFPSVMDAVFEFMVGELLPADERERLVAIRRPDQEVVLGVWSILLDLPAEVVQAAVDRSLDGYAVPYLSLFGLDPGDGYASWLAARIPGSTCELWADHGHYPHLVDPDRFVVRLMTFWSSLPR
jgi:pimeloyl-ACP methyl ester carboxylesterase